MMTMSNQNMNWNQFLTEFVLRAMTNNIHEHYFSPSDAARLAQLAWDAIQAAELPESEKSKLADANNLQTMPTTKEQLKRIAEEAAAHGFKWIAQDGVTQRWYGYITQPEYQECSQEWLPTSDNFEELNLPDATDYSKQIFNVNELLNNE